jgi:putative membrane protein
MKKTSFAVACLLFAAPACAQSLAERTGINSVVGMSPSTDDFVTEAAGSGMFEIQSSQLAEQRSQGPTKDFAAKMITDHRRIASELKALVDDGKVKATLPTQMSSSEKTMLDTLQNLQGEEFTHKYQTDQISAHQDAVSLFQRYAKGGDNDALKTWATNTLPILQDHLKMAQNLTE